MPRCIEIDAGSSSLHLIRLQYSRLSRFLKMRHGLSKVSPAIFLFLIPTSVTFLAQIPQQSKQQVVTDRPCCRGMLSHHGYGKPSNFRYYYRLGSLEVRANLKAPRDVGAAPTGTPPIAAAPPPPTPVTTTTLRQRKSEIPGRPRPSSTGYPIQDEVSILMAAGAIGALTGVLVGCFKTGIATVRNGVYGGPYAELVHNFVRIVYEIVGWLEAGDGTTGGVDPATAGGGGLDNVAAGVAATVVGGGTELWHLDYILFPLVGGVLVGLLRLVFKDFGPGLAGVIENVNQGKQFKPAQFLAKQTAAITTLGSGCSLGPEGPSVEIGIASSRILSSGLGLSNEVQRVLASAGAAAGVSAGFNAPLTGVMFALEIVQPSVAQRQDSAITVRATAGAVLTAAALAGLISRTLDLSSERFFVKDYNLVNPLLELPVYLTLGILSGVVAATFRKLLEQSPRFYEGRIPGLEWMARIPVELRPVVGAALCGLVAARFPEVLFFGYETLDVILKESAKYTPESLLTLMGLKLILTASSAGSGLVGGIFAPSLFLGSTLGAAYCNFLHEAGMDIAGAPSYAMVGAAAVLAATFRAPITGILLLFELTRDYDIVLPLMASVGIGTVTIDLLESSNAKPTWFWWWQPENQAPPPAAPAPALPPHRGRRQRPRF